MSETELLPMGLEALDAAHADDPRTVASADGEIPRELWYARRMTSWLERLEPAPSTALLLAVRAQHLERWRYPRSQYPEGRSGYLRWRIEAARRQAERAGEILRTTGFDDATVARVEALVRKQDLTSDPETQLLEDAACLVFLETELAEFAASRRPEQVIDILRKSLRKMSNRGRQLAGELDLDPELDELRRVAMAALS